MGEIKDQVIGSRRPAVGREIRRWRHDRSLTLARVAERSGLNIGYLSQIENEKASPSLEALGEIDLDDLHWAIVGGESGPKSRPIDEAWVTEIRDQCLAARVPFFFKQWGGTNKKKAGKLLEGRIWNEMPRLVPAAPAKPTRRLPIARTGPCLPDAAP